MDSSKRNYYYSCLNDEIIREHDSIRSYKIIINCNAWSYQTRAAFGDVSVGNSLYVYVLIRETPQWASVIYQPSCSRYQTLAQLARRRTACSFNNTVKFVGASRIAPSRRGFRFDSRSTNVSAAFSESSSKKWNLLPSLSHPSIRFRSLSRGNRLESLL